MTAPERVLAFWLDEMQPKDWYNGTPDMDQAMRDEFEQCWSDAQNGTCGMWLTYPTGALAYIILNDQFSRNMFRDTAKAFASDGRALAAAKSAIDRDWDLKIDPPARQFFYLPLMHSENLCDQERAVRLFTTRMPKGGVDHLLHAQAHREVIRKFGRFPTRNDALGRKTLSAETGYLDAGGYGAAVRAIREGVQL